MLISGKFCAFFDPQEHIWKSRSGEPSSGKKFRLTELQRNSRGVLNSFNGICGFTSGIKNFKGTLFRFPLRKVASKLSKKCYSLEQVEELSAVLRDEANYLLLFLRSVKKINFCHLDGKNQMRKVLEVIQTNVIEHEVTVCAPNSILQCPPDKRSFAKQVWEIFKGDFKYSTPKVVTGVCSVDVVVIDQKGEHQHHWLLVQQVGSSVFHVRDEAAEQCVFPWVGTAIEATNLPCGGGRLFCFLPMPCEATAPIPIAVNGTFALNDNRRSLKWPAAERKHDPEAEWNKLLIEHCLPSCYVRLLLKFIEMNTDKGTSDEVYRAWPNANKVCSLGEDDPQNDWSGFLKPFFTELFTHKVVFAESCTGSCWVNIEDENVIFNDDDGGVSSVVVNVLLQSDLKVAKLVPVLQSAIKLVNMDITIITPEEVRCVLKDNYNAYQDCSSAGKLELLNYCLKDGNYTDLVGLELLPLHNGEYIKFTDNSQDVDQLCYLCRDHFLEILCDCRHLLVNSRTINLEQLAERQCTQLQMLEVADVAQLLRHHMPKDGYDDNWLETFWTWVTPSLLHLFKDLPLLPVGQGRVALLKKSAGVVFVPLSKEVKSHLSTALHKYDVQMVEEVHFRYLQLSPELMSYVHQFDGPGVLDAISYTCSETCESIELTAEEASALQVFLDDSHRTIQGKRAVGILCRLAIFQILQHPCGHLVSINSVMHSNQIKNVAIAEKDDFDLSQDFLPQAPLVLSQAHNQPSLLQVLVQEDSIKFMTKMSFLCEVLLPMINKKSYSESKLEKFMMKLLKEFKSLTDRYPTQKMKFIGILKGLHFLRNTKGEWKSPEEMYNPKHPLICSLFKGQDVFPVAPFNSHESVLSLKECGLRGLESVTAQCIVNIIEEIGKINQSHEPVECDSTCYERAHAVVKFLNDHQNILDRTVRIAERGKFLVLTSALKTLTGKYCWLPVCCHRPSNYPSYLTWKGSQYSQHLASSKASIMALDTDFETSVMHMIMGSEMLFLKSCPSSLTKVFSSSKLSFVSATTAHLETIIGKAMSNSLSWMTYICPAAYHFLDNACKSYYEKPHSGYLQSSFLSASSNSSSFPWYTSTSYSPSDLKEDTAIVDKISCYRDKPFLLVGEEFVKPSQVAKRGGFDGPYLYSLPDNLVMMKYLRKALGIKDNFDSLELVFALNRMYQDYGSRRLPKECCNVVNKIMGVLSDCDLEEIEEIYLPDESYRLHKACDLCVRESWYEADRECMFVCDRLSRNAAIKLGVKTVSSLFLQQYVSNEQPFGQREDLIRRIKNILSDYPLDNESNTFLKELIQNADDAKATKMYVLLDKRTHSSEHVLSENWSELQGPALLVWNNAEFSERDLKGIQQLGLGSKHSDSESIGQFGIGFNVVYHITDCPSFITGGTTLCILDPYCHYTPRATVTAPGRRFDKLDEAFWNKFSGLKNPYLRDQSQELQGGSLFRFPLRQTASDSSEEFEDGDDSEKEMESGDEDDTMPSVDADELEGLLNMLVPQVEESLLFLNHVTHFSFYVISEEDGIELRQQYEVHIDEDDLFKKRAFNNTFKLFRQNLIPQLITYHLSITSGSGNSKTTEDWLVQQGVGDISGNRREWSFLNQISPRHGLAASLSPCKAHTCKGKAFCFLPLPINTNLPIHVNGQFILSKSRRSLWISNEQDKSKIWNDNLIEAISSSYAHFLVIARQYYVQTTVRRSQDLATALSRYYQLFPYLEEPFEFSPQLAYLATGIGRMVLKAKKSSGSNPENVWKSLCEQTFKKLWTNNAEVLAFCERDTHGAISGMVKWHVLHNSEDTYNQAYFAQISLDDSMEQLLVKLGMVVTCAPIHLRKHFKNVGYNPMVCKPREVYSFYITFHEQILQSRCPVLIDDTPFQTPSQFVNFTLYVTELDIGSKFRQYYSSPFGHPLLLTADNYIRVFSEDSKVIDCYFSHLFPKSLYRFLHPSMAEQNEHLSPKYFSKEEPLTKVIDIFNKNLPPSLFDAQRIDNSNGEVILWDKLQLLWMCLYYTPVFNQHKQAIVEQFAIIPTFNQHLYSTKSSVLPLVLTNPYMQDDQITCSEAYHVLKTLDLPVIDAAKATLLTGSQSEVLDMIKQYCANMSDRAKVLKTLYYFHIQTGVLSHVLEKKKVSEIIQTLFKYFHGILFFVNNDSKKHIESLPLFKTVRGTYTSVWKRNRFIWPDGCCMAGYLKWADTEDVVLLEGKKELETLYHYLDVCHLPQKDVYMKFVLKAFQKLDETERKAHLLFIKDSLFDTIVPADQVKFLNQMKTIPCLEDPDSNGLLPVSHFSKPNIYIFQIFAKKFKFPDACYHSESWLTFFEKIGLKTSLEANEFVSLCELVASGDHISTEQASNCLKQYLFSKETCKWLDDTSTLEKIGNICFVRPNPLHELDWIKPPCSPVNCHLKLTTLKGAAVFSCAKLVWTLMPVVVVPSMAMIPNSLSFKKKLGMIIKPSARDIYTNIMSISQTGLADFKLFKTYHEEFICRKNDSKRMSIVDVMCECLKALYQHGDTGYDLLKNLVNVPCIPVSADCMDSYVLVNSFQVVLSMSQLEVPLKPYINELPTPMHVIFAEALSRIGVTSQVQVKHLEYMLETIHTQIGAGEIQTDQLLKVRTAVLKLAQICTGNLSHRDSLTCLYLPCHEGTLVKSTTLLVDDFKRFEDVFHLDFTSTSYRIFVLPPCSSYGTFTMNMSENIVCQSLPERLRPKSLTVFIDERIVEGAKVVENTDLCDQVVEMAQFHQHIQLGLLRYLEADHSDMKVQANCFSTEIDRILTSLEVKSIMNLEAQLFLTLDNPPSFLGTRKVQFILGKDKTGSFFLYLDSMVASYSSRKYWRELSQSMCIQAARNSNSDPATFLMFSKSLSEFLQIRNLDDLRELTHDLSVSYDDIDTPFSLPQLGAKVSISDCHQDINNIFRAQKWVAYEVSEGQFIFAIVLHPILQSRGEENAGLIQRKYLIQFGKKEEEFLEVSALDLYKLIDYEADHEEVTHTIATRNVTELRVARHTEHREARHSRSAASSSTFATGKKLTNKQKLKELKKKICEDLREVWNLPEKDRRKALKRLFLHYHPDKAKPEEVDICEEAFKFLQRQIQKLDSGQNMDDPEASSTFSDTHQSSWSKYYQSWSETAQKMSRDQRQRKQERRKGFSGYQPTANSVEANRWLRQAKADCCSMMVLKHSVQTTPDTASMLCFVAHQVVEKALKAGMYKLLGLDPACLLHHQLSCHAAAIYSERPSNRTRDLCATSAALEKHYIQARYPNAHDLPTAPVDIYTIQEAEQLADLAKQALEIIQKLMM